MPRIVRGFLYFVGTLITLWASASLFFDFPISALRLPLAIIYPVAIIGMLVWTRAAGRAVAIWVVSLAAVMAWWFSQQPTNTRNWQLDVDRVAWAEVTGDRAVIHNVRNFDYRTEKSFTPHWETRTVGISTIRGVDLFLSYSGSPSIAHTIASFGFADGTYLAVSIEARKTVGQEYSALRAFFRQYEVLYLIADERDVVGVRTNHRGESVYLYHTLTTPADAQNLFRQYLDWMNEARLHPQWYNALTRNCTSTFVGYLADRKIGGVTRWDWRTVIDGYADQMLYELGDLAGNLPFQDLKQRALINSAARQAGASPYFSQDIREGRPGFP